jgi:hypothetical protein
MRALTRHEEMAAQKRILLALDATLGNVQCIGHLAGLFQAKRFSEMCKLIESMTRNGELEYAGHLSDGQVCVRRKATKPMSMSRRMLEATRDGANVFETEEQFFQRLRREQTARITMMPPCRHSKNFAPNGFLLVGERPSDRAERIRGWKVGDVNGNHLNLRGKKEN